MASKDPLIQRGRWATTALFAFLVFGAAFAMLQGEPPQPPREEALARHRNLGKAFYENPTTQAQAVEEFQQALALTPDSVRDRLNYGLALLRAGKTPEGIAELEKVQKQDPKLPHTWFNLGIQYKKLDEREKALQQFKGMIALVANEPISHYNVGVLLKAMNRNDDAVQEFETASKIDPNLAAPHFQLFNLYRFAKRTEESQREFETFKRLKAEHEGAPIPEDVEWSYYAEVLDVMEDKPVEAAWVEPKFHVQKKTAASAAGAFGDYNNDGLADVCRIVDGGAELYTNMGAKGLVKSPVKLPGGDYTKAVWLDFDHDYDLDLFLLGPKPVLMRNEGTNGFTAVAFPFAAGEATDATVFRMVADTKGMDLLVSYKDHGGVLYIDKLGGKYEAMDVPLPAGASNVQAVDLDNDGWIDVLYSSGDGLAYLHNEKTKFTVASLPGKLNGTLFTADLANRGLQDVVTGGSVLRNDGAGKFTALAGPIAACKSPVVLDTNQDGRVDVDCGDQVYVNDTELKNHFIGVSLIGIKNLKLAPFSEVEIKAGQRYQKQMYWGQPLVFGLGGEQQADTVRITWANGLIQNEMKQPAGHTKRYEEAQRLSGSCPIIWTWNGSEFEYITDVLGVAPLGASSGDGQYFPVDHDEYIQIPANALKAEGGRYQVRISEELAEVSYLDQVQLIAVDHPREQAVYSNDKFKSPPFPEFRLFGVRQQIAPVRALDSKGRDVRSELASIDHRYPENFSRTLTGVAETHTLDLDFGRRSDQSGVLILNGWVDWADGSTFLSASQESKAGLVPPYLQVKNAKGQWQTVIEDMGMPAGKPKTIAVDLSGKWLSSSREVRIVTNLCVYWDQVFLAVGDTRPEVRQQLVPALSATLGFRGFSPATIHPQRLQPEVFTYTGARSQSMWNPTPGMYTRFGDVLALANSIDDKLIIMGSGDELRLQFDATGLPLLPQGWTRDFLLKVDGWAKDRDANTAYSQTVEPLPFHGMSRFPYNAGEHFPDDADHLAYRREYNTRPALQLLRSLAAR